MNATRPAQIRHIVKQTDGGTDAWIERPTPGSEGAGRGQPRPATRLHIDTADCGVPVAALLCSAPMHDSRAAVPLSRITEQRVTNLYDLMDAAYCSKELHAHCRDLGHVPLIDHNPRGGDKELHAHCRDLGHVPLIDHN
eukprot:gene4222-5386_t